MTLSNTSNSSLLMSSTVGQKSSPNFITSKFSSKTTAQTTEFLTKQLNSYGNSENQTETSAGTATFPSNHLGNFDDFGTSDENIGGVFDPIVSHLKSLRWFIEVNELTTESGVVGDGGENESFFNSNCTSVYNNNDSSYLDWGNLTNCTDSGSSGLDIGNNYWALLLLVFPLFTIFGNVLVILSVKRERSLQNVTNYFIVSLAVADLLVAAVPMPFGVYFLLCNNEWLLSMIYCDIYIAMDVTCSTSSILNLVAISIDRYIAVTQPIKYAKHKSNTRIWLTIVTVWVISGLVGSPIVFGLNTPDDVGEPGCAFHNKIFIIISSLCSFYIPCAILVCLYYRIFKVIRDRAKKAMNSGAFAKGQSSTVQSGKTVGKATVIENVAQTQLLAETALGPTELTLPEKSKLDDEKCTNTGSGSQEDGDDLDKDGDVDGDGDGSPDSDDCHIIPNSKVASAFVLESAMRDEDRVLMRAVEPNGNHDSGYAASNLDGEGGGGVHPVGGGEVQLSPRLSLQPPSDTWKRNGLNAGTGSGGNDVKPVPNKVETPKEPSTSSVGQTGGGSKKAPASRFTICKVHKASRKKREKSSAKRERKATKTLAIVLGLFLACWAPFFTCNIMDAICVIVDMDCSPSMTAFLLTTWLGYINSCLNPVIYTIFNPEFRKAFKKLLGMTG